MAEEAKVILRKDDNLYEGEIIGFLSKRILVSDEENEYRSHEHHCLRMSVLKDGSLHFCDCNNGSSIYFFADQLEHLQKALEVALKQRG